MSVKQGFSIPLPIHAIHQKDDDRPSKKGPLKPSPPFPLSEQIYLGPNGLETNRQRGGMEKIKKGRKA